MERVGLRMAWLPGGLKAAGYGSVAMCNVFVVLSSGAAG